MDIADILSRERILVDATPADKASLLKQMARRAAAGTKLPPDATLSALLKREELGSTGMGEGIAIPHARLDGLAAPFGMLARLKHPIDFDAVDGAPVDLVFLLLLPTSARGDQLEALAAVSRALRDAERVGRIRRAPDAASVFQAISAP